MRIVCETPLSCCSPSWRTLPSVSGRHLQSSYTTSAHFAPPRRLCQARAQGSGGPQEDVVTDDDRIEELERGRRRRATKNKSRSQTAAEPSTSSSMAEWREGSLLPEGWESMSGPKKVTELWMGKRGALFWANKAAWASVFVVGGAWVLFRIVGPALGIYTLKNDLLSPPNL